MWCTAATTTTSTVPMRRSACFDGPTRAAAHEMWCTTATTTTVSGVPGSFSDQTATVVQSVCGKSPRVSHFDANVVGTDDTLCRLRNAGIMAFLPSFAPRTEPPVKLREVGQDRGHLLTQSCGDVHLNGVQTTLLAVSRTQVSCRSCPGSSRGRNRR